MAFINVLEVQVILYIIALIIFLIVRKKVDNNTVPIIIFIIFILMITFLMSFFGLIISANEGIEFTLFLKLMYIVGFILDIVVLILYINENKLRKQVEHGKSIQDS